MNSTAAMVISAVVTVWMLGMAYQPTLPQARESLARLRASAVRAKELVVHAATYRRQPKPRTGGRHRAQEA